MKVMVGENLPIKRIVYDWDVSQSKMKEFDRQDLINLFRYYSPTQIETYEMDGEECIAITSKY
jgi:hypothetical protein